MPDPVVAPRTPPNRRVLLVEDEPRLRAMLERAIPDMGFVPAAAASGEDALVVMRDEPASIVVLDLNLPGISGLKLFEKLREQWPGTEVIILTGYGDLEAAQQAIRLGVADFLTKPCSLGELEQALDRAWRRRLDDSKPAIAPRPTAPKQPEPEQPKTIHEMERRMIVETLQRNKGNRTATARELGISLRTLYYRLSEYHIDGDATGESGSDADKED